MSKSYISVKVNIKLNSMKKPLAISIKSKKIDIEKVNTVI